MWQRSVKQTGNHAAQTINAMTSRHFLGHNLTALFNT